MVPDQYISEEPADDALGFGDHFQTPAWLMLADVAHKNLLQ